MKKFAIKITTFLVLFTLWNCSSAPIDESDPAALYKEAESDIESEHYQVAIDKLRAIKNKFPYSNYAVDAQLRIADVYFLQDSFIESAASYESFRDLHPKHPKTGYAMYKIAKSYFNDKPGNIARDMTSAKRALDAYRDFLKRFPTNKEAEEGAKDIVEIRNLLAEKELYIAEFYFKRDFFISAKPRFQKIMDLYPETDSAKIAQGKLARLESEEKENEKHGHPTNKSSTQ
jgi:outer membrane protein assembly factor BamD